jgi:hypothetical protein
MVAFFLFVSAKRLGKKVYLIRNTGEGEYFPYGYAF